jgi:stalled ribosome alternative rescue factor ArfA
MNKLLGDTRAGGRAQNRKQNKRAEEEEADENYLTTQLLMRDMPKLPSVPILRKGEENEDTELAIEYEDRDQAKFAEAVEEANKKEENILVQKYQKKGMWDDNKARELVDKALSDKREELQKRGKGDFDTPESAIARNQKYKLGDVTLSIEHTDDATIRRHKEHVTEVAAKSQELIDRKEKEIVADEDPELIDALLDHPSRIDKIVAAKEGQEILEFDSQEELEEFEANKGKPSDEKMTKSRAQIIENTKRGPAITKNEHGAENISLLYDEAPPQDRAIPLFNDPLKRLKYLPIYPGKVRKWVTYPYFIFIYFFLYYGKTKNFLVVRKGCQTDQTKWLSHDVIFGRRCFRKKIACRANTQKNIFPIHFLM